MQERWKEFEMAYTEVKKAQEAFWRIITQLRARARVPQHEIDASVQSMDAAQRGLLALGRTLLSADADALIWTSPREHP